MGLWGWIAFDIFTLIASYLSITVVSAQTILRTLGLLTFMVPVGFSTAASILIGTSIGADKELLVKHYFKYCMYLSVGVALFTIFILVILDEIIFAIFTS